MYVCISSHYCRLFISFQEDCIQGNVMRRSTIRVLLGECKCRDILNSLLSRALSVTNCSSECTYTAEYNALFRWQFATTKNAACLRMGLKGFFLNIKKRNIATGKLVHLPHSFLNTLEVKKTLFCDKLINSGSNFNVF